MEHLSRIMFMMRDTHGIRKRGCINGFRCFGFYSPKGLQNSNFGDFCLLLAWQYCWKRLAIGRE